MGPAERATRHCRGAGEARRRPAMSRSSGAFSAGGGLLPPRAPIASVDAGGQRDQFPALAADAIVLSSMVAKFTLP